VIYPRIPLILTYFQTFSYHKKYSYVVCSQLNTIHFQTLFFCNYISHIIVINTPLIKYMSTVLSFWEQSIVFEVILNVDEKDAIILKKFDFSPVYKKQLKRSLKVKGWIHHFIEIDSNRDLCFSLTLCKQATRSIWKNTSKFHIIRNNNILFL
jgi:hypothetical protein